MIMDRKEEIRKVAFEKFKESESPMPNIYCFIAGAEWADSNPQDVWHSFRDSLPEKNQPIVFACIDRKLLIASYQCMKFNPIIVPKEPNENVYWMAIPEL